MTVNYSGLGLANAGSEGQAIAGLKLIQSTLNGKSGLGWDTATVETIGSAKETDMVHSLSGNISQLVIPKTGQLNLFADLSSALRLSGAVVPENATSSRWHWPVHSGCE